MDYLGEFFFSIALVNEWVRDSAQLPEPLLDLTPARS